MYIFLWEAPIAGKIMDRERRVFNVAGKQNSEATEINGKIEMKTF